MTKSLKSLILMLTTGIGLCTGISAAVNQLPDDSDVEIDPQVAVSGLFSNSTPAQPRWRVASDSGYQSNCSIYLTSDSTGMGVRPVRLPAGKYTFSFYARSNRPQQIGYIGVTNSRSNWPLVLKMRAKNGFSLGNTWKRYSVVFEADGKTLYSGYYGSKYAGAYFDRFMIHSGTQAQPWKLASPRTLLVKLPAHSGNVYPLGKPVAAQILLRNNSARPETDAVTYQVSDYTNKILQQGQLKPTFDRRGIFSGTVPLQLNRSGWFKISAHQKGSGLQSFNTLVVTRPPEPNLPAISPFIGLCSGQRQLEACKLIGVKWLQQYVSWYNLEPQKNKLVFAEFDNLLRLKKQGFKIQALVTTGPPNWAIPPAQQQELEKLKLSYIRCVAPQKVQDEHYRPAMREFMKRYRGVIDVYELGGELDALLGLNVYYKGKDNKNMLGIYVKGESFDLACHMMKIAAEEILKAQPDARISTVRPSDVDSYFRYAYSHEMFKVLGKYMNCFGIDCYPQPRWIGPGQPETGTEQQLQRRLADARSAMKGLVRSEDVMISEYGYFVDFYHLNNLKYTNFQLNRLVRSFLKARLIGMKSLCYFTTQSNSLEGRRYYMGLWHEEHPLPAVAGLNNVGRVVENVTSCREIRLSNRIGLGVFHKYDHRAVAALWSIDSDYTPEVELNDDKFELVDIMGNALPKTYRNGKLSIRLSEMPVFLWRKAQIETGFAPDNYARLGRAVDHLKIIEACPLEIFLRMSNQRKLKAYLVNSSLKNTVSGEISIRNRRAGKFHIAPNLQQQLALPLPAPGKKLPLQFQFAGKAEPFLLTWQTPQLIKVKRIAPAKLNAQTPWYRDFSPIEFSGKDHVYPVDHNTYNGPEDLSAKLYLAHDGRNLYFAAEVTDDYHFNGFSGAGLVRGDSLQIGLDPEMNFIRKVSALDPDDSLLSCALTASGAQLAVERSPQKENLQQQTQFRVTRQPGSTNTVYQLKMPLKQLGADLRSGKIFGFNCLFKDADTNAPADYWLFWQPGLGRNLRPDKFAPCILQ